MPALPPDIMAILATFAPAFSRPVWCHIQVLLIGAILAPGQRMVTSVLQVLGLHHLTSFQTYHRVLNRAVWSSLEVSRLLPRLVGHCHLSLEKRATDPATTWTTVTMPAGTASGTE